MPETANVPDFYIDGVALMMSPFDLTLQYTRRKPGQDNKTETETVGLVRMSLEHAKVMAMILRKALKAHEDAQGAPIALHPQIYQTMSLSKTEDW